MPSIWGKRRRVVPWMISDRLRSHGSQICSHYGWSKPCQCGIFSWVPGSSGFLLLPVIQGFWRLLGLKAEVCRAYTERRRRGCGWWRSHCRDTGRQDDCLLGISLEGEHPCRAHTGQGKGRQGAGRLAGWGQYSKTRRQSLAPWSPKRARRWSDER